MARANASTQGTTATAAGGAPKRRRRGEITRDQIAQAALRIVDEEGVEALTMRRLADVVGVGTMTVYGYFRNKEELLDAAIDAASSPVDLRTSGPWRLRLERLVIAAWQALEAHSALVAVRLQRPVVRPEALRFGEEGMAILRGAGFSSEEAARLFRLVFTYTVGFAALSPSARTHAARRHTDVAIAGLESVDFPNLRAARDEFVAAVSGRDVFEFGLQCVLDGIEHRLSSS